MSVGDRLARGDKSAAFAAGQSKKDDPIELHNVAKEEIEVFTVTDRRPKYDIPTVVAAAPLQYPEPTFKAFTPIIDRILVMRVTDNSNMEVMSDGSLRDKKTGFIIPATYRQHSNTGIVLATGHTVVLGQVRLEMSEFVRPGDKITYGDYNSEVFHMDSTKAKALCDELKVNYIDDPEGMRIVRVQDVRGVEVRNE